MRLPLLSCTPIPFLKGGYSKRKEFAPKGSKFFPFIVDPCLERSNTIFERVASPESASIPLNDIWCTSDDIQEMCCSVRFQYREKVSGYMRRKDHEQSATSHCQEYVIFLMQNLHYPCSECENSQDSDHTVRMGM